MVMMAMDGVGVTVGNAPFLIPLRFPCSPPPDLGLVFSFYALDFAHTPPCLATVVLLCQMLIIGHLIWESTALSNLKTMVAQFALCTTTEDNIFVAIQTTSRRAEQVLDGRPGFEPPQYFYFNEIKKNIHKKSVEIRVQCVPVHPVFNSCSALLPLVCYFHFFYCFFLI